MPDRIYNRLRAKRADGGRKSLNLALASLVVAAAGYLLGFLLPLVLKSGSGKGMGSVMFLPIGGFSSLFLAVSAIVSARRVKGFVLALSGFQRDRLERGIDLERQVKFASYAFWLAVGCIAGNPLVAFTVVTVVRRA